MPKKKYTPAFKAKIVISIIQGEKEFNEICTENNLNPNMVRKWKQEFFDNAYLAFGADTERKALLTLLERHTRKYMLVKIAGKTASAVMDGFAKVKDYFGNKFSDVFKTITTDNGSEFAALSKLEEASETLVYYAHPYASWEKGSNERHNRLLRRFIAKGKRISDYGLEAIARIEEWCNNVPRKILGYKTPDELFEAKLDEIYAI